MDSATNSNRLAMHTLKEEILVPLNASYSTITIHHFMHLNRQLFLMNGDTFLTSKESGIFQIRSNYLLKKDGPTIDNN
jgi:hypothetical protein